MRQFGCIEVKLHDALLMRDAIRPLAKVDPYDNALLIRFCEKLYSGILRMKCDGLDAINIGIEEHEALFINQFVSNEDWDSALRILEQTWLVLYELEHREAYPRQGDAVGAVLERLAPQESDAATYR